MATTHADVADAVRRHPSSRHLSEDAQDTITWRQLSMFADQGFPDDRPNRLRRPQEARRVRALREQLRAVS